MGLAAAEFGVVGGDGIGFSNDRLAQGIQFSNRSFFGVALKPRLPLGIRDREGESAIPELRKVLDDPPPAREGGEVAHAGHVDQSHFDGIGADFGKEMAKVKIAMMELGVVKIGGQIGGGNQQAIEWDAGLDEFVGGLEAGEVFENHKAAPAGEISPGGDLRAGYSRGGEFLSGQGLLFSAGGFGLGMGNIALHEVGSSAHRDVSNPRCSFPGRRDVARI